MEEALYEVPLLCRFARIDLVVDTVPDEATLCRFRHLLERHGLAERSSRRDQRRAGRAGSGAASGDGGRCDADQPPTSLRNRERRRDPEMSSTKKGNPWYFGMKAHVGVDLDSGVVHRVVWTTTKRMPRW